MEDWNYIEYVQGATFTVTLGSLIENGFDIGLKDYPIFDESYRDHLNHKIIEHYWLREIGQETPALFRHFINENMNEIMPYYNQLYKTTLLEYDPFINYDLTTKGTADQTEDRKIDHEENTTSYGDNESESITGGSSRTLVSTTPQMQLSGNEDYATNITDTASETKSSGSGTQTGESKSKYDDNMLSKNLQNYITEVTGITGITKSEALQQYRNAIINVDLLIIEELAKNFMMIYTNYSNLL